MLVLSRARLRRGSCEERYILMLGVQLEIDCDQALGVCGRR